MNRTRGGRPLRKVPTDIPGRLSGEGQASGSSTAGGFPGAPPGGGAPGRPPAPSRQITVPVPWLVRPPNAREINIGASGVGFTAANTPAVIVGSQFTTPPDNAGVLRSVVFSVNTLLVTSAITFSITFNGSPVEGWVNVPIFPRAAGSFSEAYGPDETFIFIPEQTGIEVSINVTDAGTYQAGCSYHGWSYPKRLADQFSTLYQF